MKTLNKAVARYNGISLIVRILIGLIAGAVLALAAPGAGWVSEFGNLFVGALKGIAPVLVFVIVASALAQGSSKLDRRFGIDKTVQAAAEHHADDPAQHGALTKQSLADDEGSQCDEIGRASCRERV